LVSGIVVVAGRSAQVTSRGCASGGEEF